MRTMHLIELPSVSVSVKKSHILNRWVHIRHVLEAPETAADYLGHRKSLAREWCVRSVFLLGEKDRHERESDASLVIVLPRTFDVRDAHIFTAVPLIKKTVDSSMELGKRARLGLEAKRDIKGSVSCCFNQDQIS